MKMSNTTRATTFGGLTLAAIIGLACLVVWLAGQWPMPALDEGNLTARQEYEKKQFLEQHSVEVLKTSSGTLVYLLTCRSRSCNPKEELTAKRPDWVAEDGRIVLSQDEKEWVIAVGPAKPPAWMTWMDGQYNVWQTRNAILGLQVMAVLFAAAGAFIGFEMARKRLHPALWWAPTGASLVVGLVSLQAIGGLTLSDLTTWGIGIVAMLCFAIPGGFFFAMLHSLEHWPFEFEEEVSPTEPS